MQQDQLTEKIIGCALAVHRELGSGMLESVYEKALCVELRESTLSFENQKILPVHYKGQEVGDFRIDILVENSVILELKAVDRHDPVYDAQLLSYMRAAKLSCGLLINFNQKLLKHGIKRMVL